MNPESENVQTETQKAGEPAGAGRMPRREFEAFINKKEVARRMQRTVRTVDNLMKRRLIPFYKIGRSVSFKWSEIEADLTATCRVAGRYLK